MQQSSKILYTAIIFAGHLAFVGDVSGVADSPKPCSLNKIICRAF